VEFGKDPDISSPPQFTSNSNAFGPNMNNWKHVLHGGIVNEDSEKVGWGFLWLVW